MPQSSLYIEDTLDYNLDQDDYLNYDSYDDDPYYPDVPSSTANQRPAKKHRDPKKTGLKRAGKERDDDSDDEEEPGHCYLLDLPNDVLHLLLVRIPPRTLLQLSATCKALNEELKSESVWRQCYINHFFWDGAASDGRAREEVKALVQGCLGTGGRGWKKEALSREGMLERWTVSRSSNVVHHPFPVLVNRMSLSYPHMLPNARNGPLMVGKMNKSGSNSPAGTSGKLSHRQQYEAMKAVSTRPPPALYSASQEHAAVIKSDPLTGKVSKGVWGPTDNANFHIRPQWDPGLASAIFMPKRAQSHILWGLLSGSCVHTTLQSRTHAKYGGRPTSLNVMSRPDDMHEGAVLSIHQPESYGKDPLKWVTGGQDGRVKYWQFNPGTKSGKNTPTDAVPATVTCLFTAEPVEQPLKERAEEVRLRQMAHPDGIYLVRCDLEHDVVCGVTEDGDLRVWFNVLTNPREVRVDVGSEDELGGVRRLDLCCSSTAHELVASVLIHHHRHPNFARHDISLNADGTHKVTTTFYSTPKETSLTCLEAFLLPNAPISQPTEATPTMFARIVTPSSTSGVTSPATAELEVDSLSQRLQPAPQYGRVVVGGDFYGRAYIWEWDGHPIGNVVQPMRDWRVCDGKITAAEMSCGLVAIGAFNGQVGVFDPLPRTPERLRNFRPPSHLTPGDLIVAESDEHRAKYFNVNHIILENDLIVAAIGRNVLSWRAGTGKGRQSGKDASNSRRGGGAGSGTGGKGHSRAVDLRDLHQDAVDSHYEIQAENEVMRAHTTHEEQHIAAMEDLGLADGDAALRYALIMSEAEANAGPAHPSPDTAASAATPSAFGVREPTSVRACGAGADDMSDDEAEAIRLVEEFERSEAAARAAAATATATSGEVGQAPTLPPPASGAGTGAGAGQDDDDDLADILEQIRLAEERERES